MTPYLDTYLLLHEVQEWIVKISVRIIPHPLEPTMGPNPSFQYLSTRWTTSSQRKTRRLRLGPRYNLSLIKLKKILPSLYRYICYLFSEFSILKTGNLSRKYLEGSEKSRFASCWILIWSWCTWWRPWFLQRRHVWPIHRGGGAWRRFEFPGK